jgi:hypothetical protein
VAREGFGHLHRAPAALGRLEEQHQQLELLDRLDVLI